MSRSLGASLPDDLRHALSQSDLAGRLGRGLPLLTLDSDGRPHPMLCTYTEVLAISAEALRVVTGATSGSARNLAERRLATLLIIEPERVAYVKCRATGAPLMAGALARFTLKVKDVLEDDALAWEGGARITSGIVYAPAPSLDTPEIQAALALLRQDAG
jgi:flavin reductase (DIM6/NTAB) family NADH-FMN oxidoreductase RutF